MNWRSTAAQRNQYANRHIRHIRLTAKLGYSSLFTAPKEAMQIDALH